jgi:hypothetical protein
VLVQRARTERAPMHANHRLQACLLQGTRIFLFVGASLLAIRGEEPTVSAASNWR